MENRFYDERVQHKKMLLSQRDILLEKIGQDVYDRFELPQAFQLLRQEFDSIDITVAELRDRYRAMKEERDRARIDEEDLMQQRSKLERDFARRLQGPQGELDAALLDLQYAEDQRRKGRKTAQDPLHLQARVDAQEGKVRELKAEKHKVLKALEEKLKPLDERLRKLDSLTRRVLNEEEQLAQKRGKRLQDLGRTFYRKRRNVERYSGTYDELDELQQALADNRRERPIAPIVEELSQPGSANHWYWLVVLLLLAILLVYLNRTQYREQTDLLPAIALEFQLQTPGERTFADLTRVDPLKLATEIPEPASLPGGELTFRGLSRADLREFLVDRDDDGTIRLCGLRFQKTAPRFAARLTRQGWQYLPNAANWRALIDPEGQWIWVSLNPRAFVLLPGTFFDQFQQLPLADHQEHLYLRRSLPDFGNNDPLLQGLDTLELRLIEDQFFLDLRTPSLPLDWEERKAWMALQNESRPNPELEFSFQDQGLRLQGSPALLTMEHYDRDTMKALLVQATASLGKKPGDPVPLPGGEGPATLQSTGPGQRIVVFALGGEQPEPLTQISAGSDLTDLVLLNDALIAVDQGQRKLWHYQFQRGTLIASGARILDEGEAGLSMNPSFLAPAPDGDVAVVFEREPLDPRAPKILLLRLQGLQPLFVEEMPRQTGLALSADWSADGETLYVGCAARRIPRGETAPAVLVYRRNDDVLQLSEIINLPHDRANGLRIENLFAHPTLDELYLHQLPHKRLVRYALEGEGRGGPNWLIVGSGVVESSSADEMTGVHAGRPLMLPNRTLDQTLLLETTGGKDTMVFLVATREDGLAFLDSLALPLKPLDAVRLPLRDTYWFSGPDLGVLAQVRIEAGEIRFTGTFQTTGLRPEYLAVDRWGEYLFVAGKAVIGTTE